MAQQMEPTPAVGTYPSGLAGLSRDWDGHAWTDTVHSDPSAQELPKWQRHPFAFLTNEWFETALGGFFIGIAITVVAAVIHQKWLNPLGAIGTLCVMLGFVVLMTQRVVGRDVISVRTLLLWGIIGGVVGFGFGYAVEYIFADLLHLPSDNAVARLSAGPAEELGKILVPVILFMTGRFRDPRAGFLIVISSGAVFGVIEGIEYVTFADSVVSQAGLHPSEQLLRWASVFMAFMRPFTELMHPVLIGFVAAVAWQAAWKRGHFFTWPAIGAFVLAAAVHSFNDALASMIGGLQLLVAIPLFLIYYFVFTRRSASQLVPPQAIATNPPGWRPRIPKKLRASVTPSKPAPN